MGICFVLHSAIPSYFRCPGSLLRMVWPFLLKLYPFVNSGKRKIRIAFQVRVSANMAAKAILNSQF